ncbi:hypothetical protein LIER_41932 [Lithospermum erythrorhizon]|uniref:Uncharacterized protein n=1 Tax=Lithospermum erythrorhizon TaxID=34254 RepID=A0AAV3RGI5_LITER
MYRFWSGFSQIIGFLFNPVLTCRYGWRSNQESSFDPLNTFTSTQQESLLTTLESPIMALEVFSVEPLAIRRPSSTTTGSSSAQPTNPSSQAAGSAQTGATADKTGDAPTASLILIRDSLLASFSNEDHVNFRQYLSIPSSVDMRLPLEGDQVFEPRVDPSQREGAFARGWTVMYIESLSYGARFPFSPFIDELLLEVNRAPGQLRPIGWLAITIFIVACKMVNINLTVLFSSIATTLLIQDRLPLFPLNKIGTYSRP